MALMASTDSLLPLDEVTRRLRIRGQRYLGVQPIPVANIVGSVDRMVDFDRAFHPRRRNLRDRVRRLRQIYPDGQIPAIAVYDVGGLYFVNDGHHRVALARELQIEFVDAEITRIEVSHRLGPDVDVRQLIHTEQHRIFKERTGLLRRHPEARIEFSRPTGYGAMLDIIQAYSYEASVRSGSLLPAEETTASWYETEYLPALEAVRAAELPDYYAHKTPGDIFLWVHGKRRELRTTNPQATWSEAAVAARREGVSRAEQEALKRERRTPLPSEAPLN
jgi:hypothetical protein